MSHPLLNNNSSITHFQSEDLNIYLLGTAHISAESINEVKEAIQILQPDEVAIELDEKRYESLKSGMKWSSLNLKEIIKKKQLSSLVSSLVLGSYQKRMGDQTGVKPGSELLTAATEAEAQGIQFSLIDRDVRITLKRVWRGTAFLKKTHLLGTLVGSLFDRTEVSEEELAKIKEQDTLTTMINEMEEQLPSIKRLLIDERDHYMASHLLEKKGTVLAIVGAGHVPGMMKLLESKDITAREELNKIPPVPMINKSIPWLILMAILSGFAALAFRDLNELKESLITWTLANGIPSSIGALIALAHPLVILSAFVIAPITSLNPMIGAGIVTALMQTYLMPPTVAELESASDDLVDFKKWYQNRFLKIILVFILPSLGSAIGTYVGIADIIIRLFN